LGSPRDAVVTSGVVAEPNGLGMGRGHQEPRAEHGARAVGFASLLGVFPANQSGNMVFLGTAIGATAISRWRWSLLVPCAVLAVLVAAWALRPAWFAAIEDDATRGQSPPLP
jgi:hypothetical protein